MMFNLLMFNADWPSGRVTVPIGRMFEYTDEHMGGEGRGRGSGVRDGLAPDHGTVTTRASRTSPHGGRADP